MDFSNLNFSFGKMNRSMNERNFTDTYFLVGSDMSVRLEARFYCTDSGTVHCAVWIRLPDKYGMGSGRAGGAGYDKMSAALSSACRAAGMSTENSDEYFSGCGMSFAMSVLSDAMAKETGLTFKTLHAHA